MQYKYSVNGTTYLIPEEQVDAFLQQFPNAQLIETVGDEAGKQTGVAEPAAAVAPESEAADTASESEDTSLVSPDPAVTAAELPGRKGIIQWGIDTVNAVYTGLESGFLAEDYIDVLNKTADTDDYKRIANAAERLAKVPPSRAMTKFMKDAEDAGGGIGGWFESTKNNGLAVGSQVFLQSMAQYLGGVAGTAREIADLERPDQLLITLAGSGVGAAAGAGVGAAAGSVVPGAGTVVGASAGAITGATKAALGSYIGTIEAASKIQEILVEELGLENLTQEKIKEYLSDEENLKTVKRKAVGRGLSVGIIESITIPLAGKAFTAARKAAPFKRTGRQATGLAAAGTVEGIGGATGEAVGQAVIGEEIEPANLILEGISGQTTLPFAVGSQIGKGKYRINRGVVSENEFRNTINELSEDPKEFLALAKAKRFQVIEDQGTLDFLTKKVKDASIATNIDRQNIFTPETRNEIAQLENDLNEIQGRSKGAQKQRDILNKRLEEIYDANDFDAKFEQSLLDRAQQLKEETIEQDIQTIQDTGKKVKVFDNDTSGFNRAINNKINQINRKRREKGLKEIEKPDLTSEENKIGGIAIGSNIYIDKTVAAQQGQLNVAGHELLHTIVNSYLKTPAQLNKVIDGFKNQITLEHRNYVERELQQRGYSEKEYNREYLNIYSDGIVNGEIAYNEGTFTKIGNYIRDNIFVPLGILDANSVGFKNGRQVYNFLKEYNNSIQQGKFSDLVKDVAEKAEPIDMVNMSKSKANEIDSFFEANPSKRFETAELFRPLITQIVNRKYRDVPGFNTYRDLIIDEAISGKGGVFDIINTYNPEIGTLTGNVNQIVGRDKDGRPVSKLERRITGIGNRILPSDFTQEITEIQERVEAPAIAAPVKTEIKKSRNTIDRLNLSPTIKNKAFNATSKILQTILPQVSLKKGVDFRNKFKQGVRDVLFKDVKQELGGTDREAYIDYVKANAQSIYEILPVDALVKRNPSFVEQQFDKDGKPIRAKESFTGKKSYAGNLVFKKKPFSEIKDDFINEYTVGRNALETRRKFLIETVAQEIAADEAIDALDSESVIAKLEMTQEMKQDEIIEEVERNFERGRFINYSKTLQAKIDEVPSIANTIQNILPRFLNYYRSGNILGNSFEKASADLNILDQVTNVEKAVIKKELNQTDLSINENKNEGFNVQQIASIMQVEDVSPFTKNQLDKNKPAFNAEEINIFDNYINNLAENSALLQLMGTNPGGIQSYNKKFTTVKPENSVQKINKDTQTDDQKLRSRRKRYVDVGPEEANTEKTPQSASSDANVTDAVDNFTNALTDIFKYKLDLQNRLGGKINTPEGNEIIKEINAFRKFVPFFTQAASYAATTRSILRSMAKTAGTTIGKKNYGFYFEHTPGIANIISDVVIPSIQQMELAENSSRISLEGKRLNENLKNKNLGLAIDRRWKYIFEDSSVKEKPGSIFNRFTNTSIKGISKIIPASTKRIQELNKKLKELQADKTAKDKGRKTITIQYGIESNQNLIEWANESANKTVEDLKAEFGGDLTIREDLTGIDNNLFVDETSKILREADEAANLVNASRTKAVVKDFENMLNRLGERASIAGTSEVEAKRLSEQASLNFKNFWNPFLPFNAEDFYGFIQNFAGKGKQGDADIAFLKENLLDPYYQGLQDIDAERNSMTKRYKSARKLVVSKKFGLRKYIKDKPLLKAYTNSDAVRVSIWNKAGITVPGIKGNVQKALSDYVAENSELKRMAYEVEQLHKTDGYPEPTKGWESGTIGTDVAQSLETIKRQKHLEKFNTNIDEFLNEKNRNKIIAQFGTDFIKNFDATIDRMKRGSNRAPTENKILSTALDYINGSVAVIMHWNMRSGLLQNLSMINYINWSDNNPIEFGKRFADTKQYASDFTKLWTSDFLVNRREGVKINIQEAELAEFLNDSKRKGPALWDFIYRKTKGALAAGFTPTKWADSFAIATGGAAFYRNRINALKKQGLSEKEAEAKAFSDFQDLTLTAQQSSDPSKISEIQAGPLGRVIFAFANTPMQYSRITKRAFKDIQAGRGDLKTNLSKIGYYTFAQGLMFHFLQSALFAANFSEEQTEEEAEFANDRLEFFINNFVDSTAGGFGLAGKITGVGFRYAQNIARGMKEESNYKKKTGSALMDLAGISPPISHKARQAKQFERIMKGELYPSNIPPSLEALGAAGALFNQPLYRILRKANNLYEAATLETNAMNRVLLALGWASWELGIEGEKLFVPERKSKSKKRETE